MNWKKAILALTLCLTVALTGCISKVVEVEDVSKYVTLGDYMGIEYTPMDTEVTQEQHDQAVNNVLQSYAESETITEGTVDEGDTVTFDFTGYDNGVAFENGSATNQTVVLGSGQYIPGFEEGIMGHEIGETFTIDVTFPEDYDPEMAGKTVQFEITLHSKTEYDLPDLTDEFISANFSQNSTPLTTVDEFNTWVDSQLLANNQSNAESQRVGDVWQAVLDNCTFNELPQSRIDGYYKSGVNNLDEMLDYYAQVYQTELTVEMLYGMSREEVEAQIMDAARETCKDSLVAEAIAYAEGMTITDEELTSGADMLASQNGYESGTALIEAIGKEEVFMSLLQEKVMQFVCDNAVAVNP